MKYVQYNLMFCDAFYLSCDYIIWLPVSHCLVRYGLQNGVFPSCIIISPFLFHFVSAFTDAVVGNGSYFWSWCGLDNCDTRWQLMNKAGWKWGLLYWNICPWLVVLFGFSFSSLLNCVLLILFKMLAPNKFLNLNSSFTMNILVWITS